MTIYPWSVAEKPCSSSECQYTPTRSNIDPKNQIVVLGRSTLMSLWISRLHSYHRDTVFVLTIMKKTVENNSIVKSEILTMRNKINFIIISNIYNYLVKNLINICSIWTDFIFHSHINFIITERKFSIGLISK